MAQTNVTTPASHVNTPSTYRPAGSCGPRAYVACDDTPYWEEQPVTRILPNPDPNHTPERAAKVRAMVRAIGGVKWGKVAAAALAVIDANPEATVAELLNLVTQ